MSFWKRYFRWFSNRYSFLKYLDIEDRDPRGHSFLFESRMPNLEREILDLQFNDDIKSLTRGITSVEDLSICLHDVVYGGGIVFSHLTDLELCVCSRENSRNLLVQLLEDSPNFIEMVLMSLKDSCCFHLMHRV